MLITYSAESSAPDVEALITKVKTLNNGTKAAAVRADLRLVESPKAIVAAALAAFPKTPGHEIDILVNNAGCEQVKALADITPDDFASVFDLNVRGTLLMTQAVLPHLHRPGRIINVSSIASRLGFAGLAVYSSSKAAIESLTRTFAAELGADGTTVNCVKPGPTDTLMLKAVPDAFVQRTTEMTPVQSRIATTDDVSQIVCWLTEESSRWVSGQVIGATGGFTMD